MVLEVSGDRTVRALLLACGNGVMQLLEHTQSTDKIRGALQGILPACGDASAEVEAVVSYCDISLRLMSKVAKAAAAHPVPFSWALQPYSEYYYTLLVDTFWRMQPYVGAGDGDDDEDNLGPSEEFVINAYAFVSTILSQPSLFEPSSPIALGMVTFWSKERLSGLLFATVSHGLRLTPKELASWEDDPEEYELSEVCFPLTVQTVSVMRACEGHVVLSCRARVCGLISQLALSRDEAVRPAAENLILAVLDNHTAIGVPAVIQMFGSVLSGPLETATQDQLLTLDALLDVLGICVHHFSMTPSFNFEAFFNATLAPILNVRVCCLLSHCNSP